ncbi:MAG: type II toxin-antitoxin system RelE/ParE family toxin [Bacteroidetes bacterium]|nr:MAG: type II toxin-antitoxin system RelE/ParE family toxin [Bacteroidota bacterium]
MQVQITKDFAKKFRKVKDEKLAQAILTIISEVQSAETFSEIKNVKKLSGHNNAYRIRIGKFRIGVFAQGDVIEFNNFAHRSKIYKLFP